MAPEENHAFVTAVHAKCKRVSDTAVSVTGARSCNVTVTPPCVQSTAEVIRAVVGMAESGEGTEGQPGEAVSQERAHSSRTGTCLCLMQQDTCLCL